MILDNIGKKVDVIPVKISYRIIELFSAGLYSSPNKAFEELVSNSYDANASKVGVYIPSEKMEENAIIWVCDNGKSMNKEELKDLWMIGESKKRENENENKRLQIGRFGIGKLSTYILTNTLTYICKSSDGYYGVTMNFSDVKKDTEDLTLDEIELTEEEAENILKPYLLKDGVDIMPFNLFGQNAENSWTFTLLSGLKPKVGEIEEGRLKWILSTALPLNSYFQLYFNNREIKSSKERVEPWNTWSFGQDDRIVEKNDSYESDNYKGQPCVNLPNVKNIRGRIDLYRDSLLKDDKSQRIGRSHGIFVHVRERLINLDDPLFGISAMTHGVFNRVRIIVHADELDNYITSTRESIKDVSARKDLEVYIQKKFLEVRDWYFNQINEEEKKGRASYKISHAAGSLSRRPLVIAAKRYYNNEIHDLFLTDFPKFSSKIAENEFINQLENDLTSEEGIIKDVQWDNSP